MTIYPTPRFIKAGSAFPTPNPAIDVEKWTEEAAESLNTLSIASPSGVRGTSVSLAIDLDEQKEQKAAAAKPDPYRPKRKLLRRDSLDRREALLRGKEGSRRRTRWENDRFLNNPWAQPPLASDWEVQPTHPRHTVPYYLAPLWDQELALRAEAEKVAKRKKKASGQGAAINSSEGKVPKELRQRFKKSKAARGLLHNLEEQVRLFVSEGNQGSSREREPQSIEPELSDEEIVFVGRNGKMQDMPPSPKFKDGEDSDSDQAVQRRHLRATGQQKLVLQSSVNDRSAGFGRWLVHVIAAYYGLRTWSRTIGDPARREAYVGLPHRRQDSLADSLESSPHLPTPLWGLI